MLEGLHGIPLQKHLLWYPTGQDPEIGSRVATRKVIAASYLEVCLLYKCWPYKLRISPVNDKECPRGLGRGQPVVDDDLAEAAVEIEPEHVLAILRGNRSVPVIIERI